VTANGFVIDEIWACPFVDKTKSVYICSVKLIAHNIKNPYCEITVPGDAFPIDTFCQVLTLSLQPYNLYISSDADARLSSHVFTEKPENVYSIMKYTHFVLEGQIVTNAIKVEWPQEVAINSPLLICIPIEYDIEQSELFDEYVLGVITKEDDKVVTKRVLKNVPGNVQEPD
jgi:hypothetical protein